MLEPPPIWRASGSLGHHPKIPESKGNSRVTTFPDCARSVFGDGRLGEVPCDADILVGIAVNRGNLTGFALEVGIPASFALEGALEAPC